MNPAIGGLFVDCDRTRLAAGSEASTLADAANNRITDALGSAEPEPGPGEGDGDSEQAS
jgi:hypothetical protein